MEDSQVEMEKQKAIVKNLEFHQRVNTEVQRATDCEIKALKDKSIEL